MHILTLDIQKLVDRAKAAGGSGYVRTISVTTGAEDVNVRGPKSCEIHGESPHAWACPECFAELRRERNHWKANHKHLVEINQAFRSGHVARDLTAKLNEFLSGQRFRDMQKEIDDLRHMLWRLDPEMPQ